jgi:hypothetical protein
LGTCDRSDPNGDLVCYFKDCRFKETSARSLITHIEAKHVPGVKVKPDFRLFSASELAVAESLAVAPRGRKTKSVSLAPTSVPATVSFDLGDQDMDTVANSEESSPAISRSPSRGRSVESEEIEQLLSKIPVLKSKRSASLRQSLPKLSVRPTPYPVSQPGSRNVSPEKRSLATTPMQPSPLHQMVFTAPASPPSPKDMNVDVEEVSGTDAALRAAGLKVVDLRSYQIDTNLSVLVCLTCEAGVHKNSPIVHAQTHGIKLTKQQVQDLNKLIPMLRLAQANKDFPPPRPDQAPIDYIKIQPGLTCLACDYSCRKSNRMDHHWSDDHKGQEQDSADCKVQTIFNERPRFFAVQPVLKGLGPQDKYRLYLTKFLPEIAEADKTIIPPISENEIPALLRVTLWHEHLAPFIKDKASVRSLRSLYDTALAGKDTPWLGKPLSVTVNAYIGDIKKKIRKTPIPARMLLMQYPM